MSDLPKTIDILEEGPREGFQIEPGPIPTARKIELIDALSATGLKRIQVASFVDPRKVPGWADADDVVRGFTPRPGVTYQSLFFNPRGLERALAYKDRLTIVGSITLSASEAFSMRNLNRDREGQIEAQRQNVATHLAAGIPITRICVMAAFGCNFSGEVSVAKVLATIADALAIAAETGAKINRLVLADSMGWETPPHVERLVGSARERWPDLPITLHLHDTRGVGIACAYAGLKMGVGSFDAAVSGLGGCPFAAQPGAPGNIATEELVFLCEEMGIATWIDLDALVDAANLARDIVGHPTPSALARGGSLKPFRARSAVQGA
jgi:isopropylmalate/homocitrate/citramalate synthase